MRSLSARLSACPFPVEFGSVQSRMIISARRMPICALSHLSEFFFFFGGGMTVGGGGGLDKTFTVDLALFIK